MTGSYKDIPQPEKEQIPICTIKQYPYDFKHCVEWSMSLFVNLFSDSLKYFKQFLNDKKSFLSSYQTFEETSFSRDLEILTDLYFLSNILIKKSENSIYDFCLYIVEKLFHYDIEKLLIMHPPESFNTETNQPFWSGLKYCPKPINFLDNKEVFESLIYSTKLLLKRCLNLNFVLGKIDQINLLKMSNQESCYMILLDFLYKVSFTDSDIEINLLEFDKDDEVCMDFIYYFSCLRADNYLITKKDREDTRSIAGQIIPSVLSSTCVCVGFNLIQLCNILNGFKNEDHLRRLNFNLNTSVNLYMRLQFKNLDEEEIINIEEKCSLSSLLERLKKQYDGSKTLIIKFNQNEEQIIYKSYFKYDTAYMETNLDMIVFSKNFLKSILYHKYLRFDAVLKIQNKENTVINITIKYLLTNN